MIVTIANCAPPGIRALVAENLALLRARAGRKVLLVDTGAGQECQRWSAERACAHLRPSLAVRVLRGLGGSAEIERLRADVDDVVILTDGSGGPECRWALIAAQVALVPLAPDRADIDTHYECIARLNSARMFNPGLRVLFAAMAGERTPTPPELAAVRAYASQVMAAAVAETIVHVPALAWGTDMPGRCACDIESSTGAAEMATLYGEVYRTVPAIPLRQRIFRLGTKTRSGPRLQ